MGQAVVVTILFLAADPSDASRLRLGEEFREIKQKLQSAVLRDRFKLTIPEMSLRPSDISQCLLSEKPQIVHFSGHGTSTGELCFEDELGNAKLIEPDAMAALFEQFADQVNCVLLNACYSESQAESIAKHISYVIGMNKEIGDKAAIAFTVGFYQGLGAGRTIEQAFQLGLVQIRLQGIPGHLTPVLKKAKAKLLDIETSQDLPNYPFNDFKIHFRDIVAPKKFAISRSVMNLVFGNIASIRESTIVIPINENFDFLQRGPRSVLSSFENITIGRKRFFDALDNLWPQIQRPTQCGVGTTQYLQLPNNGNSLKAVLFVVTTRNLSTKTVHYGRYVNTPIDGIDFILDKVLETAVSEKVTTLALPLLGAGYANVNEINEGSQLIIQQLVLGLTIHKLEGYLTSPDCPLKRGVVVVYSPISHGDKEHAIWNFVIGVINKEPDQRLEQIETLMREYNRKVLTDTQNRPVIDT